MRDYLKIDEVIDLHKQGKSLRAIAIELWLSYNVVKKMLMETEYYYQMRREKSDKKVEKVLKQLGQSKRGLQKNQYSL